MSTASRNYVISDADLTMFVSNLVNTMTRDLAELADFSVDADTISDFQELGNDFEMFPPDTFYQADVSIAAENKDNKRAELLLATRKITNRALAKWGQNSPYYSKFGVKGMSDLNDKEFLATSRLVILSSEAYLSQLASEGLTQDMIDDYTDLVQAFELALESFNNAVTIRDIKTIERIEMGNELYALVTRYCTFGKTIWEGVNEAKYNDYIIYTGTSPGSLTAPQNFMFDPVNYDFSWSAVENATSYILQESNDGVNWTQYWSGHDTTCAYEESPNTVMFFRAIAHNAGGNSAPSSIITYDFAPGLIAPANLNYNSGTFYFTWDPVPNAEYYEFQYRAQTNPTWNSLNAGSSTSFYHADPPGDYLARVRAGSGPNFGPWSSEEEYSVGAP